MSTLQHSSDGRATIIPMSAPVESRIKIMGQSYRLMTWSRTQWERTAPEDRPLTAWPHGDGMAALIPR